MKTGVVTRRFGIVDVVSSLRYLTIDRWATAALCVLIGLSAANLIGRWNGPELAPAQVVVFSGSSKMAVPAVAAANEIRLRLTSAALLRKAAADLNLSESGVSGDQPVEAFLTSAIAIAPSDRASVIDISVNSGAPRMDALIANYLARSLLADAQSPDAKATAPAATPAFTVSLVAKARVLPAPSVVVYQAEIIILSLLTAGAVLALGLARELRPAKPVEVPVRAEPVIQRGILEQIDMLERMWPDTGRTNPMPEGSNDEPEQVSLKPARHIVVRMAELRQDARKVMEEPTEEALENVLTDMQSLRDEVRWITAEQLRRRRIIASFR
jgi:hypothetical protein